MGGRDNRRSFRIVEIIEDHSKPTFIHWPQEREREISVVRLSISFNSQNSNFLSFLCVIK